MIQPGKTPSPRSRLPHPRFLWPILLLLALFVLFFELVADGGGSSQPLPLPSQRPAPTTSQAPHTFTFPDAAGLSPANVPLIPDAAAPAAGDAWARETY